MIKLRLGALLTHPIQYYSPWLKALAAASDLSVYYAHQQTGRGQADAGFGTEFEWDVPLLDGYDWRWLKNISKSPGVSTFFGCDTPEIASIVRREKFDALLMFGWNQQCFIQAAWAAKRNGTPVFVRVDSQLSTPRAAWKRLAKKLVYAAALPRLGHYMSPGIRTDEYLRHYCVPNDRIHRVAHMVDTARFAAGAREARDSGTAVAARARHGATADDCVFLFVGKFIEKKRPMLLLQALEVLAKASPEKAAQAKLWLVGDGPLRGEMERFARDRGLPVAFLGFANQSQLPAIYAAADCLVLPSNSEETWGLVVNEAFACGLPAIVSDEAGCAPDLIEDGVTGWTLRKVEAGALAELLGFAVRQARDLPRAPIAALSQVASYPVGVERVLEIVRQVRDRNASP